MLKYNNKLEEGINIALHKLYPNYKIGGSFRRKSKYITDVDVSVPDFGIIQTDNLPDNVIFLYLTSGQIKYPWTIESPTVILNYNYEEALVYLQKLSLSDDEMNRIKSLLSDSPIIDNILLIENMIYQKIKIIWLKEDIQKGFKIVNNNKILLKDSINEVLNILHYFYKFDNNYIPIDIGKSGKHYNAFDKVTYLANLKKEYYYMLSSLKKKFYNNKDIYDNITYILEIKLGCYKQVIMDVFYYGRSLKYHLVDNLNDYELHIINKIKICSGLEVNKIDSELEQKLNDMMNQQAYIYYVHYNELKN